MIGVSKQFEVQPFLGAELLVGIGAIQADPNHHRTFLLVLCLVALEIVCLQGASTRKVLGVKYSTTHWPR